eukprot:1190479-Prorocentrum_minimum.AAC.4
MDHTTVPPYEWRAERKSASQREELRSDGTPRAKRLPSRLRVFSYASLRLPKQVTSRQALAARFPLEAHDRGCTSWLQSPPCDPSQSSDLRLGLAGDLHVRTGQQGYAR